MMIFGKQLSFITRGTLLCAGLFLALFCVASPRVAQAIVPAKAPDVSMKGATYVGTETCVTCHEEQGKKFKLSPHARISPLNAEDGVQGCEACHGPGSIHAENGGGKGNAIINPKKDPSTCFACHMEKKMEFRLPNHHPVLEGKMSCSDCHELHGPDAKASATSMESENETCFKCHKDQQGPFVFEHPAMREGCSSCHKVHGSINGKMLQVRSMNLCLKCHVEAASSLSISADAHTNRSARGTCWSTGCHSDMHGSNFQQHLKPY